MAHTQKVTVFFSWQSDSSKKTNRYAILDALNGAAQIIGRARPNIKVVPDEATRDTSGSPNIALKILEKIQASDVLVADITTITPAGANRACPNPNVSYEVGYAVSELGWDRIILLFNQALGDFGKDLPFDIVQQRVGRYRLAETDSRAARKPLLDLLVEAILAVIDKNPKRPSELRGLSPERLKHEQDVKNMVWLMSRLHLPTLQDHIDALPDRITNRALWFWEACNEVVTNSLFNLHDPVLSAAVIRLFSAWKTALSHENEYRYELGANVLIFDNLMDLPLPPKRERAWKKIEKARVEMGDGLRDVLNRLRASYLEIDIHKTNEMAWRYYVAFEKQMDQMFSENPLKRSRKKAAAKRP